MVVGIGICWFNVNVESCLYFVNVLNGVFGGVIVLVFGGVIIKNSDGEIFGVVGIIGDMLDNDEVCVVVGIEVVDLIVDCG